MKENISGFKVQGGWNGVVDHGKKISNALEDEGIEGEKLEDWDEWRPKLNEDIEDITEKTVKKASIKKNTIEKKENGLGKEVEKTKEKLTESVDSLKENNKKQATNKITDTLNHFKDTIITISRMTVRKTERLVYRLMTKFTPYYFDNQLVSAELKKKRQDYTFEININNDDLKTKIQEKI